MRTIRNPNATRGAAPPKAGGKLQPHASYVFKGQGRFVGQQPAVAKGYRSKPSRLEKLGMGVIGQSMIPGAIDLITHRGQGNKQQTALAAAIGGGPKFPEWMAPPGRGTIHSLALGHDRNIGDLMTTHGGLYGSGAINERRLPFLRGGAPAAHYLKEAKLLGEPNPGGSFLEHLARLSDPQANREFLKWMMENHYRRPN